MIKKALREIWQNESNKSVVWSHSPERLFVILYLLLQDVDLWCCVLIQWRCLQRQGITYSRNENNYNYKYQKQCQMLQSLRKRKTSQTNFRNLASSTHISPFFQFSVLKLKLRKSRNFLLVCVSFTSLVLAFKKSHQFFFVQAAKIIKSKMYKDQISLTLTSNFCLFFKF